MYTWYIMLYSVYMYINMYCIYHMVFSTCCRIHIYICMYTYACIYNLSDSKLGRALIYLIIVELTLAFLF